MSAGRATKEKAKVHIRWMIRRDMPDVMGIELASFEYAWTEDDFLVVREEPLCDLGGAADCWRAAEDLGEGAQKVCEPAQQEVEVEAGGCEDGVGAIALSALEMVSAQAVIGLEVADDGLDGGPSFHLALDGGCGSADLA